MHVVILEGDSEHFAGRSVDNRRGAYQGREKSFDAAASVPRASSNIRTSGAAFAPRPVDFRKPTLAQTDSSFEQKRFYCGPSRAKDDRQPNPRKRNVMKIASTELSEIREILERKRAELVEVLRKRYGSIAIQKSADQMDEIQYASERDLAIGNVDRESSRLREVKAALRRIEDRSFGTCIECESVISPRRLAAVPWAPRCIQCQEAADRDAQKTRGSASETLVA